MPKITVLVADDHAVVRAGLRLLIDAQPDMEAIGEAPDAALALAQSQRLHPDVVVLDLSMPGGGVAIIGDLRKLEPVPRVVVLTMYDDPSYLRDAIANGADGFVSKSAAGPDLLLAIRSVAAGRSFFAASLEQGGLGMPPPVELSPREQAVLKMVAAGHTHKEIAAALEISVKTVETYRARIAEKAGLKSRAQLVRYALDLGLIGQR